MTVPRAGDPARFVLLMTEEGTPGPPAAVLLSKDRRLSAASYLPILAEQGLLRLASRLVKVWMDSSFMVIGLYSKIVLDQLQLFWHLQWCAPSCVRGVRKERTRRKLPSS